MGQRDKAAGIPGLTILGGSAAGLSYEGALRDALAKPDADWKREARNHRPLQPQQAQGGAPREGTLAAQQSRQQQQ